MKPIEPNVSIPEGWRYVVYAKDQKEYLPLPTISENAFQGHVVSCWGLTWRERLQIFFFGRLWLTLMTFHNPLQPIILTTEFPIQKSN